MGDSSLLVVSLIFHQWNAADKASTRLQLLISVFAQGNPGKWRRRTPDRMWEVDLHWRSSFTKEDSVQYGISTLHNATQHLTTPLYALIRNMKIQHKYYFVLIFDTTQDTKKQYKTATTQIILYIPVAPVVQLTISKASDVGT